MEHGLTQLAVILLCANSTGRDVIEDYFAEK